MKLYQDLTKLSADFCNGCALTIGNFDGVHLGHQGVLSHLKAEAKARHLPAVVMLFEPQANEFFQGKNAPARLMPLQDKCHYLEKAGIDAVICINFDQAFANLTAENFIKQILIDRLHVKFLSVGDDFRFGAKRQGDFHLLCQAAEKYQFVVRKNETFSHENQRISSTAIRQMLANGNFKQAEKLLNKPFAITGTVISGQQLGRTIGVPTANIALNRLVSPLNGVFVVEVLLQNSAKYFGVANIGSRPSVAGAAPLLEVHLFDFSEDIYHQSLQVIFLEKLRDERRFDSLSALQAQIQQDIAQAKAFLTTL